MKKLLFILLLIVVGYLIWKYWWREAEVARGQELFYDRVWIDHMPQSEIDTFQVMAAVTEQPVGIFQATSRWKGQYEIFMYKARGDGAVEFTYPQTRESEKVRYRAWKCNEKRFEYCLEIAGASRGLKKYYSAEGMEIGTHSIGEAIEQAKSVAQHLLP